MSGHIITENETTKFKHSLHQTLLLAASIVFVAFVCSEVLFLECNNTASNVIMIPISDTVEDEQDQRQFKYLSLLHRYLKNISKTRIGGWRLNKSNRFPFLLIQQVPKFK